MPADPRIDAYIAKSALFAQPILGHLRTQIHAAVGGLEETIKWGMPHFLYKGKNLAGIAAFKAHAALVLHGEGRQGEGMGGYGKIASRAELPSDADLTTAILAAKARIDAAGTALKPKTAPKTAKAEIAIPDDFATALSPYARANFDGFPPGAQREYLDWIVDAKRAETRAKRVTQAAEWIAEGKRRNWKYANC